MSKILILILLLIFSFSTYASYTPVTTKGSSDVSDILTFKIRAPNINITHSGSIATLGLVGTLGGGSSKAITPINGGILWTDADSFEVIPAGTSGQILQSNGASAPSWVTAGGGSLKTCRYAFGGAASTFASPTVCSAGTCVEILDSCAAATPPPYLGSAGLYGPVTFAAGTFANNSYIHCDCNANGAMGAGARICVVSTNTSVSPMITTATGGFAFNVFTYIPTGVATNAALQLTCTGTAP